VTTLAKQKIKLMFTYFWFLLTVENIQNSFLYKLIEQAYDIEIDDKSPDAVIYSCFGFEHLKYSCPRIYYTGENKRPNFNRCDYAFSFDYPVNDRNFRLPLYRVYPQYPQLFETRNPDKIIAENRKFCSFVNSNDKAKERIDLFDQLSKYKQVASGGKVRNNVGGRVPDKVKFISDYKFNIAFENASHPGYATEKLMEALITNTIPIYWGDTKIGNDFNTKAFINCHDFETMDKVIEHVKKVDQDNNLYRQYLSEPLLVDNKETDYCNEEKILQRFEEIFSTKTSHISPLKKKVQLWLYYLILAKHIVKKKNKVREKSILQL
jgi:predicted SAM-dependent methyltransferase